jgi:hypothetical protein
MSLIASLFNGSLLSHERLLQARDHYAPSPAALPIPAQLARWTDRVAVQAELGSARELAGLSDAELAALELEFRRCPRRPRSDGARVAIRAGAGLALFGVASLASQGLASVAAGTHSLGQVLSAACFLIGVLVFAFGLLVAFAAVHRDVSYGVVGLCVGTLDEQHPWLYRTLNLTHNPAAEHYRQRVLRDRGALRGMDHVLMRELVRTHEAAAQIRPARAVAEQIQAEAPVEERRSNEAVRLRQTQGHDLRPRLVDERIDPRHEAMPLAVNDGTA